MASALQVVPTGMKWTDFGFFRLVISGNIELDTHEKLGNGTYGTVWKGRVCGGREVAAKMMNNLFNNPVDQKQCLMMAMNEARKLTTIDHENIVKGLGFEIGREWFMLVMELMKETVRNKIDRAFGQRLLEKEALNILQQALEGLVYLHTLEPKPIVHRDLKCSNLLISQREVIKLGDFGLVHTILPTETGSTDPAFAPKRSCGTALWQAPEVVASTVNFVYGRKADVWSIGCCLVEMLTGNPPYYKSYYKNSNPPYLEKERWKIAVISGQLSYKPEDFVSSSARDAISILEKTFRNQTKENAKPSIIAQRYTGLEGIRPYSWEILADVKDINELRPLRQLLADKEKEINDLRQQLSDKEK
uniref:Protein kinase domain-containing protein n=1 Tax=Plectus sambesii TaxID=2011161 RepID=A0A914W334_9BILA